MDSLPHYFIGIPISKELKDMLYSLQCNLKSEFSFKQWLFKDDFHITLRFLGPVNEANILKLNEMLKQIENQRAFSLDISRIGTFGNEQRPRVLFAEVEKTTPLITLYEYVQAYLEHIGYTKETRPYHPHITLAKKWDNPNLNRKWLDKRKTYLQQNVTLKVSSAVLFQILPRQKPKYKALYSYILRGETDGSVD